MAEPGQVAEAVRILGTTPSGLKLSYSPDHIKRHMPEILTLLWPSDVTAITIHRENGDFRYELEPAHNDEKV